MAFSMVRIESCDANFHRNVSIGREIRFASRSAGFTRPGRIKLVVYPIDQQLVLIAFNLVATSEGVRRPILTRHLITLRVAAPSALGN
jgi:hypothetical protein